MDESRISVSFFSFCMNFEPAEGLMSAGIYFGATKSIESCHLCNLYFGALIKLTDNQELSRRFTILTIYESTDVRRLVRIADVGDRSCRRFLRCIRHMRTRFKKNRPFSHALRKNKLLGNSNCEEMQQISICIMIIKRIKTC